MAPQKTVKVGKYVYETTEAGLAEGSYCIHGVVMGEAQCDDCADDIEYADEVDEE